jgi:hypothetical protein
VHAVWSGGSSDSDVDVECFITPCERAVNRSVVGPVSVMNMPFHCVAHRVSDVLDHLLYRVVAGDDTAADVFAAK